MPTLATVNWGSGRREAFVEWLQHELRQTIGDRSDLEREWEDRILQWRAQLTDEELDFPYPGAANYELPLTAIHSDPVYADMMQSFHAPSDYWTPEARRKDRVAHASSLRRGLTQIDRRFIKMRRVNGKAFIDNNVLGTAVYKADWRSERQVKRRYLQDGESERITKFIEQPSIRHVPLQRIFFPGYAWSTDPDAPGGAPWIAEEHRFTKREFDKFRRGSASLPGWDEDAADAVSKHFVDEEERVRRIQEEHDKIDPHTHKHVKIYEVWAKAEVEEEGVWEDVVLWLHLDGPWILRAIHFPWNHARHPYHVTNYLPSNGIYGIGLSEVDAWAQDATSDILNSTIDNARLANTRMYAAPLGSQFNQNASIYPGKVWYMGPDESLGEVRMSDVYPSGFMLLQNLMQFAELRSGVSELRQGNLSGLPSRTPATSLLSILREGNKRFDMVHSSVREIHGEIGTRMTQMLAQKASTDPQKWQNFFLLALGEEDAMKVMEVLTQPDVDSIEESFGINVTATSAQVNKEVEKQSFIGLLQITQQIYGALVQTAMLIGQVPDPLVQETAKAAFASGVDILSQLFERFDVQNPQEHLGNLEAIASSLSAGEGGNAALSDLVGRNGIGVLQGGGRAAPSPVDPSALASILGI